MTLVASFFPGTCFVLAAGFDGEPGTSGFPTVFGAFDDFDPAGAFEAEFPLRAFGAPVAPVLAAGAAGPRGAAFRPLIDVAASAFAGDGATGAPVIRSGGLAAVRGERLGAATGFGFLVRFLSMVLVLVDPGFEGPARTRRPASGPKAGPWLPVSGPCPAA